IVVTLGMSFFWGGLAVLLLPAPGGQAPDWVRWLMTVKPPLAPMAIVASIVIALVAHLLVDGVAGKFGRDAAFEEDVDAVAEADLVHFRRVPDEGAA
ncbi:hypothetical protein AB9F42_33980, partial [Rhizobium leguminosarum]